MLDLRALWPQRRVIDMLRHTYPGRWYYEWPEWVHESGVQVAAFERHAPRYDGDDDTYCTEYRWADTSDLVGGLHPLHPKRQLKEAE